MQLIFLQLIIFASLMQMACIAFAQARHAVLSGFVRAAEDHQPLQDVFVRVVGSSAFALTDARGFYRLERLPQTKVNVVFECGL
jgi:hypothetical protein